MSLVVSAASFFFVATCLAASGANDRLTVRWEEDIATAGSLCSSPSEGTTDCQAFAHVVFVATPKDATHLLAGYARVSTDGGAFRDGHNITFEAHLVTGVCDASGDCADYGPSQMFNWGYEAAFEATDALPSEICIEPVVWDTANGDNGTLAPRCLTFAAPAFEMPPQGDSVSSDVNNFSSAVTRYCSPEDPARCRSNIHIVFSAANPQPTAIMETGGAYSYDGGASWSSLNAVAFYEQHIDASSMAGSSGVYYSQAFQFDYDGIHDSVSVEGTADNVCVRVWVYDAASKQNHTVADGDCYEICESLTYFHDPAGYCGGGVSESGAGAGGGGRDMAGVA